MACPICGDHTDFTFPNSGWQLQESSSEDGVDLWLKGLEPATIPVKLPCPHPWAALARALLEVRYDLYISGCRGAFEEFRKTHEDWFSATSSCLTQIWKLLNVHQPEFVKLLCAIKAAEHITMIYEHSHFEEICQDNQKKSAAASYSARNTFGVDSLSVRFINACLQRGPNIIAAAHYKSGPVKKWREKASSDAPHTGTPEAAGSDWANEERVLGFKQGELVLVWLGDALGVGHGVGNLTEWEADLFRQKLGSGHGSVLLGLWSKEGWPICDPCSKKFLWAAAVHRECLFHSIISRLSQLVLERHLRTAIARSVAQGYPEEAVTAPPVVCYPLLIWWSHDGTLKAPEIVRRGPRDNEKLRLHWAWSSALEGENVPGRAVPFQWPFAGRRSGEKESRHEEERARFLLVHLAERHDLRWPLEGGPDPEKVMLGLLGQCAKDCGGEFFGTIRDVRERWDRVLARALPPGGEKLVDWRQGGSGLRLRGPFFVGMKGPLSTREGKSSVRWGAVSSRRRS